MPAPPLPFIPAEQHGQLIILGLMVYAGDVEDGQRAVAPFRSLAPPLADMVKPMAYPEIYPPEDPDYHPAAVAQTMFLDHIDLQAAETILGHLQASDASLRVAQLRVLGGAMARTPPRRPRLPTAARRSWPTSPASTTGRLTSPSVRAGSTSCRPHCTKATPAPMSASSPTMTPTRPPGLPGIHLGPTGPDQGTLRPHQPVPPQPQHPDSDLTPSCQHRWPS